MDRRHPGEQQFRGQQLAQYGITEMMRHCGALLPRGDLIGGRYLLSLRRPGR
jgi:hypothetical protein